MTAAYTVHSTVMKSVDHAGLYAVSIRLRNDLYCVERGVKLYSLTHSLTHAVSFILQFLTEGMHAGRSTHEWSSI